MDLKKDLAKIWNFMKVILSLLFQLFFVTLIFCQETDFIATFQSTKDSLKFSKIKIKGIQYLTINTERAKYDASKIITITDSTIICGRFKDIDTITFSSIKSYKKMNGSLDGTGYIILGGITVLYAIALPVETIKEGGEGALDVTLGMFGVAAVTAMPLIAAGEIEYRYKGRKWKLHSIQKLDTMD